MSAAPMNREQINTLRMAPLSVLTRGDVDALCSTALAVMDERDALREAGFAEAKGALRLAKENTQQAARIAVLERVVRLAHEWSANFPLQGRASLADQKAAADVYDACNALSPAAPRADAPAVTPEEVRAITEADNALPTGPLLEEAHVRRILEDFATRRGGSRG